MDKAKMLEFDEKEKETIKKIRDYKLIDESNIVSILWKDPELFFTYDNLSIKNFIHNEWKVFYQIGYDVVVNENKKHLDEITVNLYLEKHPKLKAKYEEYGGFQTMISAAEYVNTKNIEGYIKSSVKWETVLKLIKARFPVSDRLNEFVDMSGEEIYSEYEAILNHTFVDIDKIGETKTYDISSNLNELIEELDKGIDVGLPYYNLDMLNSETNGMSLGNMYLLLAPSGVGKSSFLRSQIYPSILENNEKLVVIINEEDEKKHQKEMLVWVANNIYNEDLQKYKLNTGHFSPEVKEVLYKCADWIKQHSQQIILIPIDRYTTDKAIKIIKKYSSLGVKYFALDTFKHDADTNTSDASWLDLQLNSVKLYDTIKPKGKNVCLICTMQLTKTSTKQRYYTMENISGAKNVVDVVSGCYMLRWVLPDEYTGEKRDLKVKMPSGKNKKSKVPVTLKKDKRYQIMFLTKNRFGSSNEFCLVFEVDLSRNTYKEVGICVMNPDW
ncbi:helicase [Clostridium perfringens]|uniref:helicase n=1 Tax=Clostridium perfringens TaxID=1502 RepID=UPI002A41FCF3|nr:helicase [Clostridium perfringens]